MRKLVVGETCRASSSGTRVRNDERVPAPAEEIKRAVRSDTPVDDTATLNSECLNKVVFVASVEAPSPATSEMIITWSQSVEPARAEAAELEATTKQQKEEKTSPTGENKEICLRRLRSRLLTTQLK